MLKKKAVSPKSHPASQHIHTHVYFVHIHEYMYTEIWSIWILRAFQVSHFDSWAHIRVPHLCSVCVCVRIHTRTSTYTPSSPSVQCVCVCAYTHTYIHIKQRRHSQHPYLSFCQKLPLTPSNKYFHRLAEPPHPHSPMRNETNCTCMSTYAHPVASVKQICTLMFTTPVYVKLTYTPAHAWCSTTPVNACILSAKMHMNSCMRACAMVQKLLGHKSYCEFILSLAARASCRLSFAARSCRSFCCLDKTRRPTLFAQEIRLNPC